MDGGGDSARLEGNSEQTGGSGSRIWWGLELLGDSHSHEED